MGILTAMLFSPSHSHKRDHKDSESLSRASETTAPANSSPINTSLIGSTRLASAAITITANPSLARELYSQGMQALDSGDYKRAISRFQEVLKSDPTHPIAKQKIEQSKQRLNDQIQEYYNNGLREYSKLYYDRAQREWEKVAALSSDFSSEYFDKANRKINEAKAKLMETR
jgi:outer membrane protein assembly factor BamD (BamD/ComL family)